MKRNAVPPALGLTVGVAVTLPVVAVGNHGWDAFFGETHVHTKQGD